MHGGDQIRGLPVINATIGHWVLKIHLISRGMIWDFRCSTNAPSKRRSRECASRQSQPNSAIFGSKEHLGCQPRPERTAGAKARSRQRAWRSLIALPVEGLDDRRLHEFAMLCSPDVPKLIVTQQRARAIGIETSTPMALSLPGRGRCERHFRTRCRCQEPYLHGSRGCEPRCDGGDPPGQAQPWPAGGPCGNVTASDSDKMHSIVCRRGGRGQAVCCRTQRTSLAIVSEASIPLASGTSARFVVFRDALGIDQVAIIVGKPDFSEPVPVRLHSACLTGDVFGSRRCDCGDQLQLALARLESLGGGIILYLAQEGRGIGLANKMRAYRLQDARPRYARRQHDARLRGR